MESDELENWVAANPNLRISGLDFIKKVVHGHAGQYRPDRYGCSACSTGQMSAHDMYSHILSNFHRNQCHCSKWLPYFHNNSHGWSQWLNGVTHISAVNWPGEETKDNLTSWITANPQIPAVWCTHIQRYVMSIGPVKDKYVCQLCSTLPSIANNIMHHAMSPGHRENVQGNEPRMASEQTFGTRYNSEKTDDLERAEFVAWVEARLPSNPVGLQFVAKHSEDRYVCSACATGRMAAPQVLTHVTGRNHLQQCEDMNISASATSGARWTVNTKTKETDDLQILIQEQPPETELVGMDFIIKQNKKATTRSSMSDLYVCNKCGTGEMRAPQALTHLKGYRHRDQCLPPQAAAATPIDAAAPREFETLDILQHMVDQFINLRSFASSTHHRASAPENATASVIGHQHAGSAANTGGGAPGDAANGLIGCRPKIVTTNVTTIAAAVSGIPKTSNRTRTLQEELLELENSSLVINLEPFNCPVCFSTIDPGGGAVLKNCLHTFCRECLCDTVKHNMDAEVTCPYMDDLGTCGEILNDCEIRALVSADVYDAHLDRSLKHAKANWRSTSNGSNATIFQCQTPDCDMFWELEPGQQMAVCPLCEKPNCIQCQAIHHGLTCSDYQDDLQAEREGRVKVDPLIREMKQAGLLIECPNCNTDLTKDEGCDFIQCSICSKGVCWVTRQLRWGPGGKGDNSSGCRCNVDGVKCHPNCRNCH